MSQTKFDICNRALVRVGANVITDFVSAQAESVTAGREYEALVTGKLGGAYEWRFAMELADLGAPLGDTPADKWTYAYNLPADLLVIRAIRRNDLPIPFDRYGGKVMCDAQDGVVIEYTFRQVEAAFPAYFTEALVADLAAVFAVALNRDLDLAKTFRLEAGDLWAKARFADSKGRTAETFKASRVVAARR
jgi:hypothetical protein